ncbi:MAG: hypothetical protein LBT40_02345 [Deltaproteobacteria bacterium]|nr:hypothetical protein [Deltaproteobacteria bacterium]
MSVFGRPGSGKSTLLEILDPGDAGKAVVSGPEPGSSGELPSCLWEGMSFTEVTEAAGAGAFGGEKGGDLAMKAADGADLVVFLMTDDLPGRIDAEGLANVKRLGKPVIGIYNTVSGTRREPSLFLDTIGREFDLDLISGRLKHLHWVLRRRVIVRQIYIAHAHLFARLMADCQGLESFRERLKSFVDMANVRLEDLADGLLACSRYHLSVARAMVGMKTELQDWLNALGMSSSSRIREEAGRIAVSLKGEAAGFADLYWDDDARKRWTELEESMDVTGFSRRVKEETANECSEKVSEFALGILDESVRAESLVRESDIWIDRVFEIRKPWDMGLPSLNGQFKPDPVFASRSARKMPKPSGFVGETLFCLVPDFHVTKKSNAARKFAKKRKWHIESLAANMIDDYTDFIDTEVMERFVSPFIGEIDSLIFCLFEVEKIQRSLALKIIAQLRDLARIVVREALSRIEDIEAADMAIDIARVPGAATMLVLARALKFPETSRQRVSEMLSEPVVFV